MWRSSRTSAATVFTISSVQMLNRCPTYTNERFSNLQAVPHQYTLCASTSPSPLQITLTKQQNFIALLCSFFTSIFESSNLRGVTKTTFTNIAVPRQWKVIIWWNFDHWHRIHCRSYCTVWLHAAVGSFAIQSDSHLFLDNLRMLRNQWGWWRNYKRTEEILVELEEIFSLEIKFSSSFIAPIYW